MKKIVGLVLVLLTAVQSQAQLKKVYQQVKQKVTGSATLAQLHYFPEQWEVDLSVGYDYTTMDVKGTAAGISVVEYESKSSVLQSYLVLGLSDNIFAQLNWDYLVLLDQSYTKPPGLAGDKSKGAEDPTIAVVVRLVDGGSVKVDTKLGFQPNTGDSQAPDDTHDGNAKTGGHATTIGARVIGLVTDSSQISATIDYEMLSVANAVDQTTNDVTERSKHNQLTIRLETLTQLTSEIYFGAQLDILSSDSYKSTDLTSNSTTDVGSASQKRVNLVGKYAFTPDSLVDLQAGYLLDFSSEISGIDYSVTAYTLAAAYVVRF